ncbi:MAG: diaminopimelate epimerase [Bacteroidales bacterium]|nr:diaminopimelate epimerase [Bacteroidales bacterium]
MLQKFYKYHGAGNDFLLADNRDGLLFLTPSQISHLCDRHLGFGADGVMLLEKSETRDFKMVFFNPDGSTGMMCGNGGRCIVAYAADLGVVSGKFPVVFDAPDGVHTAILSPRSPSDPEGQKTVRLKMSDVFGVKSYPEEGACFLNTGTRHLVKFVSGLKDYQVVSEGRKLRNDPRFAPEGTNVDFVEVAPEHSEGPSLSVRTFEKGVEDETLACGTGIVASALAAYSQGISGRSEGNRVAYELKAAVSTLLVDFIPTGAGEGLQASDMWLTGPATFVGTVECFL